MQKIRCSWCGEDELYRTYHDEEWGVPIYSDALLFEFLLLETFQAGLSWITILRKRENFRAAFDAFDYHKIALYDEKKFQSLLRNSGIVRNKLKIKATISNAKAFLEVQKEFTAFAQYIWGFVGGKPHVNYYKTEADIPATSPLSLKISTDMKKRGFKFVGATVIYAFMQAIGMVNDHVIGCYRHKEVQYE